MCGRLGEEPLLAVDRERRAHEADGVQAAAGQGRGAGPEGLVAGRRLEADAVGGAAADDDDVAGLGARAAAVAEGVAALDLVDVEDRRGHRQGAAVAEPQVGADAGADGEVGYVVASAVELGLGEVADPDGAGRQPGGRRRR